MSKRPHPKLPASAFVTAALPPRRTSPRTILDSHIHLFTEEQIASGNIAWPAQKGAHEALSQPHSLAFYSELTRHASSSSLLPPLEGFVFVQAEVGLYVKDEAGMRRADRFARPG